MLITLVGISTAVYRIYGSSSRGPPLASSPMLRPSRDSTSARPRHRQAGAYMACADTGPHAPLCIGSWGSCNLTVLQYLHCVWCDPSAPLPLSGAFIVKGGKATQWKFAIGIPRQYLLA